VSSIIFYESLKTAIRPFIEIYMIFMFAMKYAHGAYVNLLSTRENMHQVHAYSLSSLYAEVYYAVVITELSAIRRLVT